MRRPLSMTAGIVLGAAILALSAACAGAPPPAPAPEPAATVAPAPEPQPEAQAQQPQEQQAQPDIQPTPEPAVSVEEPAPPPPPVRKERSVTVQIPLMTKETVFYPDGLVDEYSVYTWDETRQRLLSKSTYDPSRADPVERVTSEYNSAGRLGAETTYGSDGALKSRRETSWVTGEDGTALLVSERGFDAKGLAQYSSSYEYDAAGRRSAWKAYDSKGALKASTLYRYDGSGRLARIELRNGADNLTGSIKVDYAADGGSEKRSYLAADGSLQKSEVSFLADGLVVRFEIRRSDNSLAEATDFGLGQLGERLTTVTTDGSGRIKEKRNAEFAVREEEKVEVYYE